MTVELNEMTDDDRKFAQSAKQALRQSERALDADTQARLRAARAQAVAAAGKPRWALGWMMPAGAVAAALMVFALLPVRAPVQGVPAQTLAAEDMLELMGDDITAELVQDLDLYVWLEFDRPPA